jgi:hypothetical protein
VARKGRERSLAGSRGKGRKRRFFRKEREGKLA